MSQNIDEEKKSAIILSFFEGIGPVRFKVLKSYFHSAQNICNLPEDTLLKTGLSRSLIQKFCKFREEFDSNRFIKELKKKNISVIYQEDDLYPQSLLALDSAPIVLYAMGDISLLRESFCIGVVGTRLPTSYGRVVAQKIAEELALSNATVISGMAMGIDAIAHKAVLDVQGKTIAVLGCGVDICYPAVNKKLYDNLIKSGLVLSEVPPGKRSSKGLFPSRNRIIAGLSLGVVVVEGSEKSGALITAKYAAEFGKDVFAVPGPITSRMSKSTLYLMQNGASPIGSAHDIVTYYRQHHVKRSQKKSKLCLKDLSKNEREIVSYIEKQGPLHIDMIVRSLKMTPNKVIALLSQLEIKGFIQETDTDIYELTL